MVHTPFTDFPFFPVFDGKFHFISRFPVKSLPVREMQCLIEVRSRRTVTRLKFENYYLCLRFENRRACIRTNRETVACTYFGRVEQLSSFLTENLSVLEKKWVRKQSVFVVENCQLSFHDDSSNSSEIQPSLKIVTTTRQQPQQNQFRVFLTNPSEWKSPASRGLIKP